MDKHNGKARTITIKLNQDGQPKHKEEGVKEQAATKENEAEDQFDWILPSGEEEVDWEKELADREKVTKKKNKYSKSTTKKSSFKQMKYQLNPSMFFTILFAVVIGTGFGLVMLNVLDKGETAEGGAANSLVGASGAVTAGSETAELPALDTFIVQGGVFTTKDSAEGIAASYKEKGIPTFIHQNQEQYTLIIGVAATSEAAKTMSTQLEGQGAEVFAKEYTIDGAKVEGLTAEEKKILELSPQVYQLLTGEASPEQINAYSSTLNEINQGLNHEDLIALKEKMLTALKANNGKDAQQAVLNFLQSYTVIVQT
ncbi:SPOR domain-containing protein [Cytobacillus kochii]|uniref:SPOR domain-containing protein n=1 Tax=Cytobacillus kochii TaxID=859143 RepID=UPI001CD74843|nr:SPOR domain-containing protein [Cytobacillus kochii]MCA1025304.1 SPOR domain-containing protein [Cytobacillus kochii]MCM3323212.1 SPOR domain-containing protein [Cytobacillus kochii]MCM3345607.1 SPOR domain-containing protein [Cytobacillus kochii]